MRRLLSAVVAGGFLLASVSVSAAGSRTAAGNSETEWPDKEALPEAEMLDNAFYRECLLEHLDRARTRAALRVLMAVCREEVE